MEKKQLKDYPKGYQKAFKMIVFFIVAVVVLLIVLMIAVSNKKTTSPVQYTIVEQKDYDTPSKTQYSLRVKVKTGLSNDSLTLLCNHLFYEGLNRKFENSKQPSHIFIYVYDDTTKDCQANWAAMISRTMNENDGIRFRN